MTSDAFVPLTGKLVIYLVQAVELADLLDLIKRYTADLAVDHIVIEQESDDLRWVWLARVFVDAD